MGPNDKGRTSSQMYQYGMPLNGWNEVRNSNGSYAGSNEKVSGGTVTYDRSGNRTGFIGDNGQRYDSSGNPVDDDYDLYDDD